MKALMTITAIAALAGCSDVGRANWHLAPTQRVCTEQEMERVEHESAWCNKNTGYASTYCYGSAILRNCPATIEIKERLDK